MSIYSATKRMVAGYTGPLMRVRLPNGRAVDVYPDDVTPLAGAVRRCELADLAGKGTVTLLYMCEQHTAALLGFVP
jgi:hypothetical protein